MERLKVLFLTSWYPTKDQPVSNVFVREHAKAVQLYNDVIVLHYAGADSSIKTLWRIEKETDEAVADGIPTYRIWYKPLPLIKVSYFIYFWSFFRVFGRIFYQDFQPDVVHAHLYNMGLIAVSFKKLYRFPVVITEHSSAFPRKLLSFQEILKAHLAFRLADQVLPVSHALQRAIERYYIRARFEVIPNAVNTNFFFPTVNSKQSRTHKNILFVGTLRPVKGVPNLLQALAQVRTKRDDWHLDILGDGPARIEYERLASSLRIDDKVCFHGLKRREEVAQFMRQAHIFVLSSLWENLPCVAIEAMASGLPIVATIAGGIPEIIHEEIGLLVPPNDTKCLAEALEHMLQHYMNYRAENIVTYAHSRFSYETVGKLFHNTYLKVLRKGHDETAKRRGLDAV